MARKVAVFFLVILSLLFFFPVVSTVTGSFMTATEVNSTYGQGAITLIPSKITLSQYYELLIERYRYLHMFWNSVKLSLSITVLHVVIAVTSAYVFAKVDFKGRETLFFIYIIVMMMPFQVTLLPNYIQARFLKIYDTYWAIILPGVFAPFWVFLLRQFMKYIPDEFIEALSLESSSVADILRIAILPSLKPGIIALAVLTFAENWNMVEQPLVLMEDSLKYPLSIALNSIIERSTNVAFAGSVIFMIPILILYCYFDEHIFKGIEYLRI